MQLAPAATHTGTVAAGMPLSPVERPSLRLHGVHGRRSLRRGERWRLRAVIDVSAPTGSYQPGARDLVFVVRGAPGVKQVMLDGKALPSIPSAQAGPGWTKSGDSISIRFDDDGHRRRVEIR